MGVYFQTKYLSEFSCSSVTYKKCYLELKKGWWLIVVMSCSWLSQQNKVTFVRTFCFLQISPSSWLEFRFGYVCILWASSCANHSFHFVVLDFYRICLTRTAIGMKPASTASSARILWWTNLLLQKRNIYFVLTATPTNTLPNVMSARRLLCQVRMLTFWTIYQAQTQEICEKYFSLTISTKSC